jgi:hypothetical protein
LPYLHRWTETNRGLDHSLATFRITGLFGGRTSVPLLVNRTSGDLIGYAGKLGFGQSLSLSAAVSGERHATATLDGVDASDHLFSVQNFVLGVPFARADLDATPQLPRMLRGDNDWVFLSVGLYDIRGLNQFFFSIADEQLREASFDDTRFNHALFPSGNLARLEMAWVETEPASFELRVPRYIVSEPSELVSELAARPMQQVASALVDSIQQLRAAGVRSSVTFVPFSETQPQSITVRLPWKTLDPETAPVGTADLLLGGRFGESSLGGARYE